MIKMQLKKNLLAVILTVMPVISNSFEKTGFSFSPSAIATHLSSNTVNSVVQDHQGYLWIASQNGLHRYDGSRAHLYSPSANGEGWIDSSVINIIAESKISSVLWALTDKNLLYFDRRKNIFKNISLYEPGRDSDFRINDFAIFRDACPYDVVFIEGIANDNSYIVFVRAGENPKRFQLRGLPQAFVSDKIVASTCGLGFLTDRAGQLLRWEVSWAEELVELEMIRSATSNQDRSGDLLFSSDREIWISTEGSGISTYNTESQRWTTYDLASIIEGPQAGAVVRRFFEDKDGVIWAATSVGLLAIDKSKKLVLTFNQDDGLTSSNIVSIYQDRSGVYWVGTVDGFSSGIRHLFKSYSANTGLSNNSVNALSLTETGALWVGTDDGLNQVFPDGRVRVVYDSQSAEALSVPEVSVMSLLAEERYIWVGTARSGLGKFTTDGILVDWYSWSPDDPNSLPANGVTKIVRSRGGKLIVGTYGGGVGLFNEEAKIFERYFHAAGLDNTLSDDRVLDIYEDSSGRFWVGTERGLNIGSFDESGFTRVLPDESSRHGLDENFAWLIEEDDLGIFWIGTRNGLYFCSDCGRAQAVGQFTKYKNDAANIGSQIYSILSGENGEVWVTHNNGLTVLKGKEEALFIDLSNEDDRIEFNFSAGLSDDEGRFIFGHNRGFTIIDPRQLPDESHKPQVVMVGLSILGSPDYKRLSFLSPEVLELKSRERVATIDLSILDFKNPGRHRLAYMVEGLDREWIDITQTRRVSLSNIPAGSYFLRARAITSYGISNLSAFEIPVVIQPPFYRSNIAYVVYVISVFVIAVFFWLSYVRSRREAFEREQRLQILVSERTRDLEFAMVQAENANHAKSSFLATITHEIRTPLHGIIGMNSLLLASGLSKRQREFSDCIGSSSRQLLELINSVLDFSKVESDSENFVSSDFDLIKLIEEISTLYFPIALEKNVEIIINYGGSRFDGVYIRTDENKIRHVLRNILGNAVKFTENGLIKISLEFEKINQNNVKFIPDGLSDGSLEAELSGGYWNLSLRIDDTGIGIPDCDIEKIFEAFFQVDSSDSRKYGGTGLGLAISKRYVDLLGGDISVRSRLSEGSSFIVNVPVCRRSRPLDFFSTEYQDFLRVSQIAVAFHISDFEYCFAEILKNALLYCGVAPKNIIADSCDGGSGGLSDGLGFYMDITRQSGDASIKVGIKPGKFGGSEAESYGLGGKVFVSTPILSHKVCEAIVSLIDGVDIAGVAETASFGSSIRFPGARVIVAEDIHVNQMIVKAILSKLGCEVLLACNGAEAVSVFESNRDVDLVLIDCQMPVMDGYEACSQIRRLEDGRRRVPIVALTATALADDHARAFELGMDFVLQKPYVEDDIVAVLEKYLPNFLCASGEDFDFNDLVLESVKVSKDEVDILDHDVLRRLLALEASSREEFLIDLIDRFEKDCRDAVINLARAIGDAEYDLIRKIAHGLKSSCLNLGAKRLGVILAEIERVSQARTVDFELLQRLKREMPIYFSEVRGLYVTPG